MSKANGRSCGVGLKPNGFVRPVKEMDHER